jgi:hypothetical protein
VTHEERRRGSLFWPFTKDGHQRINLCRSAAVRTRPRFLRTDWAGVAEPTLDEIPANLAQYWPPGEQHGLYEWHSFTRVTYPGSCAGIHCRATKGPPAACQSAKLCHSPALSTHLPVPTFFTERRLAETT